MEEDFQMLGDKRRRLETDSFVWHYTDLVKVTADEAYKYVWLTYTERTAVSEQYEEVLNVLGVQTEEVTEKTEVTTDETN